MKQHSTTASSTLRANFKYMRGIVSKKGNAVRALLGAYHIADESSSALQFSRSPFSIPIVATSFFISTRHVAMAIIAAFVSNIYFFNCSFSMSLRFNSSCRQSRSISPLSSVARNHCGRAAPAKRDSIQASMLAAMPPVAKRLSDPIQRHELFAPSSSHRETQVSRLCSLPRQHDPWKARQRPPRRSLSNRFLKGRSKGATFATPESRLRTAGSVKLEMNLFNWTRRRGFDCLCLVNARKPVRIDQPFVFKNISRC